MTDRLRTVTLGVEEFRGTHHDEVPGAERLAERYGTDHQTVWGTQKDVADAHDDGRVAMSQTTYNDFSFTERRCA